MKLIATPTPTPQPLRSVRENVISGRLILVEIHDVYPPLRLQFKKKSDYLLIIILYLLYSDYFKLTYYSLLSPIFPLSLSS